MPEKFTSVITRVRIMEIVNSCLPRYNATYEVKTEAAVRKCSWK